MKNLTLALQIKEFRKRRGWTQREFARRTGVHNTTLASIPAGNNHNISVETAKRLGSVMRRSWKALIDLPLR